MKKLLLFVILFFSHAAYSQSDTIIKYWEVVKVDSVKKDVLYQRARQWFNTTFNSGKAVLEIQDKDNGQLSGNGSFETFYTNNYIISTDIYMMVNFKIDIYIKDGKYKYEMYRFKAESERSQDSFIFSVLTSTTDCQDRVPMVRQKKMNEYWADLKRHVALNVTTMSDKLKAAMSTPIPSENDF